MSRLKFRNLSVKQSRNKPRNKARMAPGSRFSNSLKPPNKLRILVWNVQNLTNDQRIGLHGAGEDRLKLVAGYIVHNNPDLVVIMETGSDVKTVTDSLCDYIKIKSNGKLIMYASYTGQAIKIPSNNKMHDDYMSKKIQLKIDEIKKLNEINKRRQDQVRYNYRNIPKLSHHSPEYLVGDELEAELADLFGLCTETYGVLSLTSDLKPKLLDLDDQLSLIDKNLPYFIRRPVCIRIGNVALCVIHAPFTEAYEFRDIIGFDGKSNIIPSTYAHRIFTIQSAASAFNKAVPARQGLIRLFAGDFNIPDDDTHRHLIGLRAALTCPIIWREKKNNGFTYKADLSNIHMRNIGKGIGKTTIKKKSNDLSQPYDQMWVMDGLVDVFKITLETFNDNGKFRDNYSDHYGTLTIVKIFTGGVTFDKPFKPKNIIQSPPPRRMQPLTAPDDDDDDMPSLIPAVPDKSTKPLKRRKIPKKKPEITSTDNIDSSVIQPVARTLKRKRESEVKEQESKNHADLPEPKKRKLAKKDNNKK